MKLNLVFALLAACALSVGASAQTGVPGASEGRGTTKPPPQRPPDVPQPPDSPRGGSAPAEPRSTPAPDAPAPRQTDVISVTGCIARADVSGGIGGRGDASTDGPVTLFRLTNVRNAAGPGGPSSSDAPGTPAPGDPASRESQPPAAGAVGRPNTFALTTAPGVDLAPHVGHLVTVTGTVPATESTMTPASSVDPTRTVGASSSESSRSTERDGVVVAPGDTASTLTPLLVLHVSAVKMVSATCQQP